MSKQVATIEMIHQTGNYEYDRWDVHCAVDDNTTIGEIRAWERTIRGSDTKGEIKICLLHDFKPTTNGAE